MSSFSRTIESLRATDLFQAAVYLRQFTRREGAEPRVVTVGCIVAI